MNYGWAFPGYMGGVNVVLYLPCAHVQTTTWWGVYTIIYEPCHSGEQLWGRERWCLHKFINYVLLYISHAFIAFPIISLLLSLMFWEMFSWNCSTKARSSKISDGWLHSLTGRGLTSFFSVLPSVITGSSFVSASSEHDSLPWYWREERMWQKH